jgi:hypothetical protein
MRANPGGLLNLTDIVGRDAFIRQLWDAIDRNSVSLEADRRVGKTSVLRKMCAAPPFGWEAAYLDVGKARSATEFAEIVAAEVFKRLNGWNRPTARLAGYLSAPPVGSSEAVFRSESQDRSRDGSWKRLLSSAIEDLVEQQTEVSRRVVFLFDDLPRMLQMIAHRESHHAAAEVLDVLRGLRQSWTTGPKFRMLICGSIGMHHVLRLVGEYAAPLNDVTKVTLPPLSREDAIVLAELLIASERPGTAEFETVTQTIADETAGYPYYIHWIVYRLAAESLAVTPEGVRDLTRRELADPDDPWDLKFYRNRIAELYPQDGSLPLVFLDTLAVAEKPMKLAGLREAAERVGERDGERVRELLRLLVLDYYLTRDAEGGFGFRLPFLRNWWIHDRELGQSRANQTKKIYVISSYWPIGANATEHLSQYLSMHNISAVILTAGTVFNNILTELINQMKICDAIIAICTPDDTLDKGTAHPRLNVVFELGIAIGLAQGLQRTTILRHRNADIPSDLDGTVQIYFDRDVRDTFPILEQRLRFLKILS